MHVSMPRLPVPVVLMPLGALLRGWLPVPSLSLPVLSAMSKRKAETLQDQQIVCKDCSGAFTFTVREQTAFAAKGFQAKVRCADCTKAKKVRHTRTKHHARHTHCRRTAGAQPPQRSALPPREY